MAATDTTSIANGISQAGRGIGQGLAMRAADMKRQQDEDKRKAEEAKKMRSMAKVLQKDLGLSDSEIQGSDASSLKGTIDGYMLSQSSAHQKLQEQRDALAIAGMKMLQRDAESRREIPKQLVEGFESRGRGIPSPVSNEAFDAQMTQDTGMPAGVRELIGAHAKAGVELPAGVMDDLIRQQSAGRNKPFFDPTMVNKAHAIDGMPNLRRIVTGPNESQILNTETAVEEVRDPETGMLLGHRLPNVKGGAQFVRAPLSNALKPADKLRALSSQLTALLATPLPGNREQAAVVQKEIDAMLKGTAAGDANLSTDEAPKGRKPRVWNPKTGTLEPAANARGN